MALDDDHIAPYSVELTMLLVNADFAKSQRRDQGPAATILRKYARHQLPEPLCLRLFDQFTQRESSGSQAAKIAGYIHRDFRDPGVTLARAVCRSGRKRNDLSVPLHDDYGMPAVEPFENVLLRSRAGFKRRHSILDSFI